ncbi:alpha/beta-hydrolase [Cytidiella melzeri]|nr:alpha/beta-hydrolase [Cytidiella melzeri]
MSSKLGAFLFVLSAVGGVRSSDRSHKLPDSRPHAYNGMPQGGYSPAWQSYFEVPSRLPGLDFDLGTSYAGNIDVQRANHPDDTLFFWGFESQNGSLTAAAGDLADKPWAIWLQGGPGTSSLYGLFYENGPIRLQPGTQKLEKNPHAWSELVDYFWIDQPVGSGFSTADSEGYAADENQVAEDFVGFLANLVQVFPSLSTRPFYLTGESYAGRYIPYISQALFSMSNPPVQLSKIVLGNPALGSSAEFETLPTLNLIKTYPQIIDYDTEVYDYFADQAHLCGLDINLTYPQTGGNFPSIELVVGANQQPTQPSDDDPDDQGRGRGGSIISKREILQENSSNKGFLKEVAARYSQQKQRDVPMSSTLHKRTMLNNWKRDLQGRANGSIDSWYGCFIWDEMIDYAVNFTYPWSSYNNFDTFDVPDALSPLLSTSPAFFLNQDSIRAAIHAPNETWSAGFNYPWGNSQSGSDPSPEPMTFLTELATNATNKGVHILIYVGNDDALSPHFGTEVTIQNTTFGGIQGFTRQPSTPWFDDNGNWAGIIHQERNWTYAVVYGAGHEVAAYQPAASFTFLREFVLGSNQTGTVNADNSTVGGENPTLQQSAIPGQAAIAYGSSTTKGSTVWPTATVAAFESYVSQVQITGTSAVAPSPTAKNGGGAHSGGAAQVVLGISKLFVAPFCAVVMCLL